MRPTPTLSVTAFLAFLSSALLAQSSAQRLVVPLSSPDKPATVELALVNGCATVEAYPGKEIIVLAETPAAGEDRGHDAARSGGLRRLPNSSLGLTVEEQANVVSIESSSWNRSASLRLQVPVHTSLKLTCVNDGDIAVTGVAGEHELQNVNGGITLTDAQGSVVASTTNGDVKVVLTQIAGGKAMAFSSFNGDVDVSLPASAKASVRLRSDQGDIFSDFDVAIDQTPPKVREERSGSRFRIELEQELRGTIGGGGPEFMFKTFNGNIYLRKR